MCRPYHASVRQCRHVGDDIAAVARALGGASYIEIGPAIEAGVSRVLAGGHYIMGEDIGTLETELAADHGLAHAIAVSSGTDALLAALWALGIGPGEEVITTAMSFFATAGAVAGSGRRRCSRISIRGRSIWIPHRHFHT